MRSLRRSASPYDTFVESLRPFLAKRLTELGGLVLFLGATALTVALATWSIDDPNLNHATNHAAHNVLGAPGAVISDLAMQLIGLGSLAFALPPALWGVRLMRARDLPSGGLRITLWIIGFFAASAVASALPPTTRWPLPTGLGGVAGDALIHAARTLVGVVSTSAAALCGFGFAVIAILAMTGACRVGPAEEAEDEPYPTARMPVRREPSRAEREESDEPSLGILSLGTIAQGFMAGRDGVGAWIRSWSTRRTDATTAALYSGNSPALAARRAFGPDDDAPWVREDAPAMGAEARREPIFDDPEPMPTSGPERERRSVAPPILHDDEPNEDAPVSVADDTYPVRSRVAAPVPSPMPVRRPPVPSMSRSDAYAHPALELLAEPKGPSASSLISTDALEQNATLLEATLSDFGVRGDILAVRPGPVVTLYELEPAPGTKSSRVIGLSDDIARSMSAVSARVAVVPGRNVIGIELPNDKRETVFLRELLASADFGMSKQKLALCLGKNIGGEPIIADLAKMPHLLVAGTTGSGKSVAINTMILSLLYRM
ncbi:DNA translocase FtsK 4TM domain-containing protein, partial [uncultured Methylobacterium sp.]|uniref:DNA translocase FtsK n=1 Tax=uncultured Methylobacterium sp. TaxID=157278 RepID=UPI0035CBEE7D